MSEVVKQVSHSNKTITFSEAAQKQLLSYLIEQKNARGVRFSVKKSGCSGLSYVVDYVLKPEDNDVVLPFVESYQVYIDKSSYPYLKGIHVDYVKQGLNSKLIFENPNETGLCGCGESFTVD